MSNSKSGSSADSEPALRPHESDGSRSSSQLMPIRHSRSAAAVSPLPLPYSGGGGVGSASPQSAQAQPPTPGRLQRRHASVRSRATLSSASPVFGAGGVGTVAVVSAGAGPDAELNGPGSASGINTLPPPRARGVGALYALASGDGLSGRTSARAERGPCTCLICTRMRGEYSFGSDGWVYDSSTRVGLYPIPEECPVASALDSVCAHRLTAFTSAAAGIDNLPLYKLHVRRTVYLLAAAGAAAARALTSHTETSPMPRMMRKLPSFRRASQLRASQSLSERLRYGARALPFADTDEPMWGLLNVRGDAWRPLSVAERMDVRALLRSARVFIERHQGEGSMLSPDEFAALIAEINITAPVPPVAAWSRAPRWQARALSVAARNRMTPSDSKIWANRMRDYLAFVSDATGVPIEVLRQLNAHCLDLAHALAICGECERSRSLRARSSSVSADSLRPRHAAPPNRRSSLPRSRNRYRNRSLSPIGSRLSFAGSRRFLSTGASIGDDENAAGMYGNAVGSSLSEVGLGGSTQRARGRRWTPLSHTQRTLLRIELAQCYRYIHGFAVQDPCADYPDELAAILAEVHITWPVPAGLDKARYPRWSPRAVPEADWNAAGFFAKTSYRARARRYIRFIADKTGTSYNYVRKLDADSFERLHAAAVFHDIDTSAELYAARVPATNVAPDDPVETALTHAGDYIADWASPVHSGTAGTLDDPALHDRMPDERLEQEAPFQRLDDENEAARAERGFEAEDVPGYTVGSLSDTAEEEPRPLSLSRRARMVHEVDEAQWYLDCAKNAATSFAADLRSAQLPNLHAENGSNGLNDRESAAPGAGTGHRHLRGCGESVSSGESLKEWLMRVESQEAAYSFECAACRGTGANPTRRVAPRWHWASLGPAATERMDEAARVQWEAEASRYLADVADLTGHDVQALRQLDAPAFERIHVEALCRYAQRHGDVPPADFVPGGVDEDARSMPHTRAFTARLLAVPANAMRRIPDDVIAGILSRTALNSMAPFGVDRQCYPPWHHRSVPPKHWAALDEHMRRERRMRYRKEILDIARAFAIPPLVVTELDARAYQYVTKAAADIHKNNGEELSGSSEDRLAGAQDATPRAARMQPCDEDTIEVDTPASLQSNTGTSQVTTPRSSRTDTQSRATTTTASVQAASSTGAVRADSRQTISTTGEHLPSSSGAVLGEASSSSVHAAYSPNSAEISAGDNVMDTSGEMRDNEGTSRLELDDEDAVGGIISGTIEEGDELHTPVPVMTEETIRAMQSGEHQLDDPLTEPATDTSDQRIVPTIAHNTLTAAQRQPLPLAQKRGVRFVDAAGDEETPSETVLTPESAAPVASEPPPAPAPVVNITRAEGATNEMYRRSLMQFARQMARDAPGQTPLERMHTNELADFVRNAVSSTLRNNTTNSDNPPTQ